MSRCVAPIYVARGEVVDQPIRGGEYRRQTAWRDPDGQWWILVHPTDARGGPVKVAAEDVRGAREESSLCSALATAERIVEGTACPLCAEHAAELDAERVQS